jgi:hypothetical protein
MSFTIATASDRAFRALRAQGIERRIEDIENDIPVALLDVAREAMFGPQRTELETVLSLTLSSADSDGLQTAAITSTVFEESVLMADDVRVAGVGKMEVKPTIGHLTRLLSTSTVPCFTVAGSTLYARRPSSALPTTASATKVKGILKLTSISDLPVGLEAIFINKLIVLGGGQAMPVERVAA